MPPSIDGDDSGSASNPYQPPRAPMRSPARGARGEPGPGRPAARFSVGCGCGLSIPVSASQAGSTVRCPCGAEVDVPNLGRLRESAGQARYESGICDTIRRMIQSGELPSGGTCAVCRKPTEDVIELDLLVPRFFQKDDGLNRFAVLVLGLFPAMLLAAIRRPKVEEEGALTVRVPILVARRYHAKVRRMGHPRRMRLLRTVPVYAELLDENPHSYIKFPDDTDSSRLEI
jgi:hypothetical protein